MSSVPYELLLVLSILTFEISKEHSEEVIVFHELYLGINAEPIPFYVPFSKLLWDPISDECLYSFFGGHIFELLLGKWK